MQIAKEKGMGAQDMERKWTNKDNNAFYEKIKVEGLQKLALEAGLSSCCDIELLKPYWSKASTILELGAGYGRVIDFLLQQGCSGQITAIERCGVFYKCLKDKFAQNKNVDLVNADFETFNDFGQKFDLILLPWSGFQEFDPAEQFFIFKKYAKFLNKNGEFIVDIIPANACPLNAEGKGEGFHVLNVGGAEINIQSSKISELRQYAKKAGFKNFLFSSYETEIGRERQLCIMS